MNSERVAAKFNGWTSLFALVLIVLACIGGGVGGYYLGGGGGLALTIACAIILIIAGVCFNGLKEDGVLELDVKKERKANMVSNLMVVLCAEKATQPIINAGSLH
ncbi:MAG: hypothetical protein V3S51_09350 [Dehalococcoidia bacterium]